MDRPVHQQIPAVPKGVQLHGQPQPGDGGGILTDTDVPHVWFLGIRFSVIDQAQAVALLAARPRDRAFAYVATPNAQHVVRIQRGHEGNMSAVDNAWLTPCDSRVLVRLARLVFGIRLTLVAGSDLTAALFEHVIDRHERITVIGGDATLEVLLRDRLGMTDVALFDPPMGFVRDVAEMTRAAEFVEAHPARFVFLACGAPQSEQLAAFIRQRGHATGTGLCIGASLKFVTGQIPRAPRLVQRAGLESLYRLLQEPGRLWRRFFTEQLPVLAVTARFRLSPSRAADHTRRRLWR